MGRIYAQNVLHDPQPPRRPALHRRRRLQGQHPHPRHPCPCCARSRSTSSATSKAATSTTATVDVTVCDGFVGNVALKTSEGLARLVNTSLRESLKSTVTSQVGALLSKKAFAAFKRRLDYSEYGGAPLLGVRGVCIVGHGSSNERAIMNGIRVAAEFAHAEVNNAIEQALKQATASAG